MSSHLILLLQPLSRHVGNALPQTVNRDKLFLRVFITAARQVSGTGLEHAPSGRELARPGPCCVRSNNSHYLKCKCIGLLTREAHGWIQHSKQLEFSTELIPLQLCLSPTSFSLLLIVQVLSEKSKKNLKPEASPTVFQTESELPLST